MFYLVAQLLGSIVGINIFVIGNKLGLLLKKNGVDFSAEIINWIWGWRKVRQGMEKVVVHGFFWEPFQNQREF